MTAQSVALGLRAKYPLQAARAKAFRKWMLAWGANVYRRAPSHRYLFWLNVCLTLDKEPVNVS